MNSKTFIIAEAGVNHNGNIDLAKKLIDCAAAAGADAVKFQTFNTEKLVSIYAAKAAYQKEATGEGSQFSMLKALELSPKTHEILVRHCESAEIEFMSTAFDEDSADFLISLGIKRIKIPSGELTHLPFIAYLAKKNLPMILSTGMATLEEVKEAVDTIASIRQNMQKELQLCDLLTLLQCTSNYPAALAEVNLKAMKTLAQTFNLSVGYSDHTAGIFVAPLAVAAGASIIEKHFTLDRTLPGPDHQASLEPAELIDLVKQIRQVELCLGDGVKAPSLNELKVLEVARRSLTLTVEKFAGEILTAADIAILRPGTGILPKFFDKVIGKKLKNNLVQGSVLQWSDLED